MSRLPSTWFPFSNNSSLNELACRKCSACFQRARLQTTLHGAGSVRSIFWLLSALAAAGWESFGVKDPEDSKEAVLRQASPEAQPYPLTCEKTKCVSSARVQRQTSCRPAKMMDLAEAHLRKERAETLLEQVLRPSLRFLSRQQRENEKGGRYRH